MYVHHLSKEGELGIQRILLVLHRRELVVWHLGQLRHRHQNLRSDHALAHVEFLE